MCYSAKVQQNLHSLAKRFGALIDLPMFEELFRRRLAGEDIHIARALESNFLQPRDELEARILEHIEGYRNRMSAQWETDLFRQKKRLTAAQRQLRVKETRKARDDERIATTKIAAYLERLATLRSPATLEEDERIFPRYYVPLLSMQSGQRIIRPMRYQCRLAGKPANYDERFPGTYNARRDSLNGFWAGSYGRHHGVMVVSSFYENVPSNLYEKRELATGEKPTNIVLHFNPQPPAEMLVACLWSHWSEPGGEDLYSFAAITDAPPAEIAATGHNRCIIALKEEYLPQWLAPVSQSKAHLEHILSDRQSPCYAHRIAA